MMKTSLSLLAIASVLLTHQVIAGPTCTETPSEQWMDFAQAQAQLEAQGYQVKKFKKTDGNCYELYGKDAEGHRVEIYFNPVDMSVVKQEVDD